MKEEILRQIKAIQTAVDELAYMVLTLTPDQPQPQALSIPGPATEPNPEIMSARQVQKFLGIGQSTFYTWIREGRLPPGELWGKRMKRWKRSEIIEWNLRGA